MNRQRRQITIIVDRQVLLLVGAVLAVLLISLIGISAYAGSQPLLHLAGVHESGENDAATHARTHEHDDEKEQPEHTSTTHSTTTHTTTHSSPSPTHRPGSGE